MTTHFAQLIQSNIEAYWQEIAQTGHLQIHESSQFFYTYSSIADPIFNGIVRSGCTETEVNNCFAYFQDFYQSRHLSFCWWVNTATEPKRLLEVLRSYRFQFFGNIQGMALELKQLIPPATPAIDIAIKLVSSPLDYHHWLKPLAAAFNMTPSGGESYIKMFMALAPLSSQIQHYTAYHKEQAVACCSLFLDKTTASLYNCGTLPQFRNLGITSYLSHHVLTIAKTLGHQQAVLQASPLSQQLFHQLGFMPHVPYQVYLSPWKHGDPSALS